MAWPIHVIHIPSFPRPCSPGRNHDHLHCAGACILFAVRSTLRTVLIIITDHLPVTCTTLGPAPARCGQAFSCSACLMPFPAHEQRPPLTVPRPTIHKRSTVLILLSLTEDGSHHELLCCRRACATHFRAIAQLHCDLHQTSFTLWHHHIRVDLYGCSYSRCMRFGWAEQVQQHAVISA